LKETRTCERCGRIIEWRRKWQSEWETIRYCSDACRRHQLNATDLALEQQIIDLLRVRARDASICPSEAVRALFSDGWQPHMEAARQAARRLVAREMIEITQQGKRVDPSTAKGPIRLRRGKEFPNN
jgi:hypothetical protein